MFRTNLLVAFRYMRRRLGFSVLNVLGMALGLACSMVLINYLIGQASFDTFHQDSDRIYRVNSDFKMGTREEQFPNVPPRVAHDLVASMPEVAMGTVLWLPNDQSVQQGGRTFQEPEHLAADSMFFQMFDFELLEGNRDRVLAEANRVLLTPALVEKYFGRDGGSPVGKTLLLTEKRIPFIVEGVVAAPPAYSQLQYSMLSSMASWQDPNYFMWSYVWSNCVSYVKLHPGAEMATVNEKIPAMVELQIGETLRRVLQSSLEEMKAQGAYFSFFLQPMEDVYLRSGTLGNAAGPVGNIRFFRIFMAVAGFLLLIACINFMNLSTAQSGQRSKEVGVRKVLGSRLSALRGQVLLETTLYTLVALFLSLVFYEMLLLMLQRWVQVDLIMGLTMAQRLGITLGLAAVMALLSGWYPAYYLTRFRPIEALKGKLATGKGAVRFRGTLVVFQFAISIGMIIATLVVYQQWQFARNTGVGFDREQVMLIDQADYLGEAQAAFLDDLRQQPGVVSASWSTAVPSGSPFIDFWEVPGQEGSQVLGIIQSDPDMPATLGLQQKAGRFLEWDRTSDSAAIVLNEAAVASLGLDDPLGKQLSYTSRWPWMPEAYTVIGVVADFHMQDFQQEVYPMGILLHGRQNFPIPAKHVAVRYQPGHTAELLQHMEAFWERQGIADPFTYRFLDESFGRLFESEQTLTKLFGVFSVFTIFIACLGLFGLAAYTAERRTKEVGVRKVLGAREGQLLGLLNGQFVRLVLVAFVIGAPVAGYAMQQWLNTFVYRTSLSWEAFALGGGIALLIALLTVSYQSLRVVRLNPVESLRDE